MSSKVERYIDDLTANGEISFAVNQLCQKLGLTYSASLAALRRLKRQNKVVSPSKGYYLILTPEYRVLGALPADFFIDHLMQ